jgi:hypothetical protein
MKKLLVLALVLGATSARADNVCNGLIDLSFVNPAPTHQVGDVFPMRIDLGTGDVTGGPANVLTMTSLTYDLSCKVPPPPLPGCVSEGPVLDFADNFSTTCPTTFSAVRTGDHVTITASPPIVIPANTFPFCNLTFDVKVLAPSTNPSGFTEQVAAFDVAPCDNGILDAGGFQTAAFAVEQANNFDCYQVPRGKITPTPVTIMDQFGNFSTTITNLHRICAPASVNDDNPGAPGDPIHLASYDIPSFNGTVTHPKVSIATKLNSFTAVIGSPVRLAVPTLKSLVSIPPPPPPGVVPNFDCYSLKLFKISGQNGVTVTDQFGSITLDIDKRGPLSLCVETTLDGVPPSGQPQTLVCNHTKNDGPFGNVTLFINDFFEADREQITQFDELCVPATVVVL